MKRVKVAELKDNLSRYLRSAESGIPVTVTDRERPVAQLVPVPAEDGVDLIEAEQPFASVRDRRYPPVRAPFDSLALLVAERGDR